MIVITAGIYLRSGCTSFLPEVSWSANRRGQYTPYKKKHMSKFASFAAAARQDCRRQNAKFGMILFLVLLSVTHSKQEQSIFQSDASDKVKLGFVNQNQEHRADFSKMVVDWEPRAMVMDVALLGDLDDQVVEVREGEVGEWQRVDNAPKQRAGMFRVRSTMARPCRPHWVRILIPTIDGSLKVYEHPRPLPAATREQLTTYQRKFVPSQPENLQAHAFSSSSASVSWQASPCAEVYEVYVGDRKEATNDTRVLLDNLDPCSDYEVSVSAVLGDQRSEEAVSYLTTPPTEDVMTTVDIQVKLYCKPSKEKYSAETKYNVEVVFSGERGRVQCDGLVDAAYKLNVGYFFCHQRHPQL